MHKDWLGQVGKKILYNFLAIENIYRTFLTINVAFKMTRFDLE